MFGAYGNPYLELPAASGLTVGSGLPVVVFPGVSADNADPTGRERRMNQRGFRPLTRHFTVYVVNRRPG